MRIVGIIMDAYLSCSSDDSDDSEDALGTGLSLDSSAQHAALTVKTEPCEQQVDGLAESKPLNGVLLQGKGERHTSHLLMQLLHYLYYLLSCHSRFRTVQVMCVMPLSLV